MGLLKIILFERNERIEKKMTFLVQLENLPSTQKQGGAKYQYLSMSSVYEFQILYSIIV